MKKADPLYIYAVFSQYLLKVFCLKFIASAFVKSEKVVYIIMESSAHETQTLRPTKVYTVWTVNDDLCHR